MMLSKIINEKITKEIESRLEDKKYTIERIEQQIDDFDERANEIAEESIKRIKKADSKKIVEQCKKELYETAEELKSYFRLQIVDAVNENIEKVTRTIAEELAEEMRDELLVELARNALKTPKTKLMLEAHVPQKRSYGGRIYEEEYGGY